MISAETFKEGMSRLACSVHIIASFDGKERHGATATALTSVSDSPASLLVCLNAKSETANAILKTRQFTVNALSADDQLLADIFAGRTGLKGEEKFSHGIWDRSHLKSALVSFECKLTNHQVIGTHHVMIAEVVSVELLNEKKPTLVYHNRGYKRL